MNSIESEILSKILNPQKIKQTIKRYDVSNGMGLVSEKRTGTRYNELGVLHEIEENITYIDTLDDGTPINEEKIVACDNCHKAIHVSSVRECARCKKRICILCARQKKNKELFYCSLTHQIPFLGF